VLLMTEIIFFSRHRPNTTNNQPSSLHTRVTTFFNNDFPRLFHDQKMNFHDLSAQHIFSEINDTRFMNAYQNKIYFQLLINQSVSKTSETTNRMIFTEKKFLCIFTKKIPGHHHHFP